MFSWGADFQWLGMDVGGQSAKRVPALSEVMGTLRFARPTFSDFVIASSEAIQSSKDWIASSHSLLAMTASYRSYHK